MSEKKITGKVIKAFKRKGKLHKVGSNYSTTQDSFNYLIKSRRIEAIVQDTKK